MQLAQGITLSILLYILSFVCAFPLLKDSNHSISLNSREKDHRIELGELVFTKNGWEFLRSVEEEQLDSDQLLCVGVDSAPEFECINFKKISPNDDIVIYLNEEKNIQQLSIIGSKRKTGLKLFAKDISKAAVLKSNPKIVEQVQDGSTKITEENNEKSFIQKYWMYIVPPLILFMVFTDNGSSE